MEDQETGYGELHLHLDGAITPRIAKKLAALQGIELPYEGEQLNNALSVGEDCQSLNEFLQCFDLPLKLLQTKEGISEAIYLVQEELKAEGLSYAELRFAPQLHCQGGLSQAQVIEAALDGLKRSTLPCNLILCCMRGADNEELNMQTVETAKKYLGDVVCAVDIAGAEGLFPTENFAPVFAKVREYGVPMTLHAGEAAGPDSMKTALSFGTKRIGHGVAAINDPELIKRLIDENVTLEVCVTSNYHTKVVPAINMHPIHKLLEAGVHVTVNSDNRTCSRTTLQKEKEVLKEELGFTDEEIEKMQEYAWEARFLK